MLLSVLCSPDHLLLHTVPVLGHTERGTHPAPLSAEARDARPDAEVLRRDAGRSDPESLQSGRR